jgi:hypothetical protein
MCSRLVVARLPDNETAITAEPFAALLPPESVDRLSNLFPDWSGPLVQLSPQHILSAELPGEKIQHPQRGSWQRRAHGGF